VIEVDTHWTLDNSPYLVTCNVDVASNAELTVEPGVVVRFNDNTQLTISGSLDAEGTVNQPITFTSANANPAPGDWGRLWFAADHGTSILEEVIIEYAGRAGSGSLLLEGGSLTMGDSVIRDSGSDGLRAFVMPVLLDNRFENNNGTAIRIILENGLGQPGQIADNRGQGNDINGIYLRGVVDMNLTLDVNEGLAYYTDSEISVATGTALILSAGVVFKLDQGALNVSGVLQAVSATEDEIVFTSFRDDTFAGDTNGDGAESLPAPGDWWRIYLRPGSRANLGQAIVRYGGAGDTNAVDAEGASLIIADSQIQYNLKNGVAAKDGLLQVTGSQISANGENGIKFCACFESEAPIISGNTLSNNGAFAISVSTEETAYVNPTIEGNTGTGNGINGVNLSVVLGNTVLAPNPNLPYVVHAIDTTEGAALTILAGTVFKADQTLSALGSKIIVRGTIQVNGQDGNPVVFTSLKDDAYGGDTNGDGTTTQPAPGDWRGVFVTAAVQPPTPYDYLVFLPVTLRQSQHLGTSPTNAEMGNAPVQIETVGTTQEWTAVFDHVIMRYGGLDTGLLELFGGRVQISNCSISYSAKRGIYAEDVQLHMDHSTLDHNGTSGLRLYEPNVVMAPVVVNNTFSNNGTYGAYVIFHAGCHSDTEIRDNIASGNGQVNGIYLEGAVTTPAGCRLGYNPGTPYVIWTVNVYEDGLLVLEPGVETKYVAPTFARGTGTIIVTGTLEAVGTAQAPIAFTSYWDDAVGGDTNADGQASQPLPGDWLGVLMRPGGTLTLDHGIIRYGGSDGAGLSTTDSALQLTNSEFSYSAAKGVRILFDGAARPITLRNNTFVANNEYAVSVRTEGPALAAFTMENNSGSGNGANGILLNASLGTMTFRANPTLPYIILSATVAQGQTVTVDPGVVFKGDQGHSDGGSLFAVDGTLQVNGVAGGEVYFTSLHDDAVGGDTLSDESTIQPGAGDWRGINVNSSGQGHLTHAVLRYAGSDNIGLYNNGGLVTLDRCYITDNEGNGISNQEGADLTVIHSLIANNTGSGVGNSTNSTASITYSDIVGNGEYGLRSSTPLGTYLLAEYNYWGSANGPGWDGNYCENPPSGSGDLITCQNVDYTPFATTPYH
jgi:hypothetical protein